MISRWKTFYGPASHRVRLGPVAWLARQGDDKTPRGLLPHTLAVVSALRLPLAFRKTARCDLPTRRCDIGVGGEAGEMAGASNLRSWTEGASGLYTGPGTSGRRRVRRLGMVAGGTTRKSRLRRVVSVELGTA